VVELWLDRNEIDQIARWLHHSDKAVERCTKWFLQAAKLHREEMPEEEIADLIQLPIWLASAYITLYRAAASKPHQRAKLKKELSRFEAR
jgi:NADH:ubiquinone oxidoreductase subunit E